MNTNMPFRWKQTGYDENRKKSRRTRDEKHAAETLLSLSYLMSNGKNVFRPFD